MIFKVVHLPYLIISTILYRLSTLNDDPITASLTLIPTPISDYFMAIKSFAPSPTIPILLRPYPNILLIIDLLWYYCYYYYFNIFIIFALF